MENPVSKTAYYCAGVRMQDARSIKPLLNDQFAEKFLGEEGRATFELFKGFRNPNGSNVTRHLLIDTIAREHVARDPQSLCVLIGAGFDARAFRLKGGRWLEVDEAAVIERKEKIAPAESCPNPLRRIAIDFSKQSLRDVLQPHADASSTLVIVEGVTMYLDEQRIRNTLNDVTVCFPNHQLVCDVMTRKFFERYSGAIHRVIESLGAHFTWTVDDPIKCIERMGYRTLSKTSIPLRAAELRAIPVPRWLVANFLRTLREGYQVALFVRI